VEGQANKNFRNLYTALNKARRMITLFQRLFEDPSIMQQQQQEPLEAPEEGMRTSAVGSKRQRTE
jgi:hypothetical protein